MRRNVLQSLTVFCLAAPAMAHAAGFAFNENYMVFTPAEPNRQDAQDYARDVLRQADDYRKDIALEWLGEELPPSVGRTVINISFSETDDRGLTWAKDHPDRQFHNVYLTTSRQKAIGAALAHEIAHVVLASQFPHPHRLPAWLEEAIASGYDGQDRQQVRQRMLGWFVRTGNWPRLERILTARRVPVTDQVSYTVACALSEFLLSQGGKQALLRFGQDGRQHGWDQALQMHYGIASVDQLQERWQAWAAGQRGQLARR
jgi:hypothetical protein